MWDFAYQARDDRGELLSGRLSAPDVAAAVQELTSQGLEIVSIQRADIILEPNPIEPTPATDATARRLGEIIERRHGWLEALGVQLLELPPSPLRRATERRIQRLGEAMTVEQFLQNHDAVGLLPLLSNDERPAPDSTALQAWLQEILQDQQRRMQRGIRWTYPLLLGTFAVVLLACWSIFILPIFREMFDDFGLNLPGPTWLVFWVSDQFSVYGLRTLLYAVAACAVIVPLVRWWRARALTNQLLGGLVAGTTENLRAMSRLTGTLAELLRLQVPLAPSLDYAGQASGHRYFADAARRTAEYVAVNADEAAASVDPTGRLPQSVLYALTAGNEHQPSIAMLRELALLYGQIAQSRYDRSLGKLPAICVLILGAVVGFVVISLFLPLVNLVTSLA